LSLRYLLDSNILSDLFRHPRGEIAKRISAEGETSICTSIIVAAELKFGAEKSASKKLLTRVELILSALEILPLERPADQHYGQIRQHLANQGKIVGPNDLLIAAHARAMQLTLVTANTHEFSRVPDLKVENWLTLVRNP